MRVKDPELMLELLGVEIIRIKDDEIRAECPFHYDRTGRPGSVGDYYVSAENGDSYCFSCGWGGPAERLVRERLGVNEWDAGKWIVANDLWDRREESWEPRAYTEDVERVVGESMLALFDSPPESAVRDRGLDPVSVEFHGVMWDRKMKTWVIPIRTLHGKLLGYQRKRGKYVENVPEDMRKSRTLFGIDVFDGGTAVLVESPLDVVRLTSAGVDGGVAAFGAGVSKAQMNLLIEEADEVVLALDNDTAGILSTQKLKTTYGRRVPMRTLCYDYTPDAKDVGEMESDAQIRRAVREAREYRPVRKRRDRLVV